MSWELNRLLKTTDITYIPGSPYIPGTAGTAGSPAYSYYETTTVPGGTYSGGPPTGWAIEITLPLPGGGTQTIRSGGYRYFNGEQAFLQAVIAGVTYIYKAPSQTIETLVHVPAVAPIAPTPPVPATPAQKIEEYNLGWNSGALGPADLAVKQVLTWRMSAGNVGSAVGLSLATAAQDNGYVGIHLHVLSQSGNYQLYRGGSLVAGISGNHVNATKFAFARTNTGTIEFYVDSGLVHTEVEARDVIADCSLYSGGDVIWDAQELARAVAPISVNQGSTTLSDAQATPAITRTFGAGTALGVAGATTASGAVCGQVLVNGSVYTGAGSTTVSAAVADGAAGATPTFGAGTARGVIAATTDTAAVAVGDVETGVGISTNVGTADVSMLPLTAAASAPNVFVGWTGNYQGDAVSMLPMTAESTGDLVVPSFGLVDAIMVPMNASATGLTGEISVSSDCQMLPLSVFASSEAEYSQAYCSMAPLQCAATSESYEGGEFPDVYDVLEQITVASDSMSILSFSIRELLQVSTPLQTFYQVATELLDSAGAVDSAELALILTVAETYNVSDAITYRQMLQVAEALVAQGIAQTEYTAIAAIIGVIALSDNKITGGSAEGATAGVSVQAFGPPSVEFTFTGYWKKGTEVQLSYTTDAGPGYISYTYEYAQMGPEAMALFAVALDAQPLVNANYNGTTVTMTAQAPATTVQL